MIIFECRNTNPGTEQHPVVILKNRPNHVTMYAIYFGIVYEAVAIEAGNTALGAEP